MIPSQPSPLPPMTRPPGTRFSGIQATQLGRQPIGRLSYSNRNLACIAARSWKSDQPFVADWDKTPSCMPKAPFRTSGIHSIFGSDSVFVHHRFHTRCLPSRSQKDASRVAPAFSISLPKRASDVGRGGLCRVPSNPFRPRSTELAGVFRLPECTLRAD